MTALHRQLVLDLELTPAGVPDRYEDLDLEHAGRVFYAELAAAPPAPACSCAPHSLIVEDEWGPRCWLCGRGAP